MISDIDIYRSARVIVNTHDKDALIEAAMRADAMLEKGDLDRLAVLPGGPGRLRLAGRGKTTLFNNNVVIIISVVLPAPSSAKAPFAL